MISETDILNAKILIVDDQEANVALLEQVLTDTHYLRVTSTMNPREVSALHRDNAYNLILLDLQMPGMDGFQVIEGLRTGASDRYPPVLVLTAKPAHKQRALQVGVRDFISKPFDLVEVRTRIHNMLEVQLLYQQLDDYTRLLEKTLQERTAELRESEARFRSLTELASDWYWEQDEDGAFIRVSGPVMEMLGIGLDEEPAGWNEAERSELRARIAAREPFLDFVFSRAMNNGATRRFQVSGQPMFDRTCRFIGYRGIGLELAGKA